jgi:hypothetical protein
VLGGKRKTEAKEEPQRGGKGPNVKLAAPFEMHGQGHTIYTEIRDGRLSVEMASDQRMRLQVLVVRAMTETQNKTALKRLARVEEKLKAAEQKVTHLVSDRTKDAETLMEADRMTQDAANTLQSIGKEFGIPSLQVLPHKSSFVEATVTGYRIKKEHQGDIRGLFYPTNYSAETRQWARDYVRDHTDPATTTNYIDLRGRSTPKNDITIDHQPRVVEHWESEGKKTTQVARAAWYTDHKGGHLSVIARKHNSSDGADARQAGLRYSPEDIGKNFLGPNEV